MTINVTSLSGRRRHARFRALPGDVFHEKYICLDISEGGVKFGTAREIMRGAKFTVNLTLLPEPRLVTCKVMWCRESKSIFEDGYHVGCIFTDIPVSALS